MTFVTGKEEEEKKKDTGSHLLYTVIHNFVACHQLKIVLAEGISWLTHIWFL